MANEVKFNKWIHNAHNMFFFVRIIITLILVAELATSVSS